MEEKVIETIMYIWSVTKKKPSIDRVTAHSLEISDENLSSIESLPNLS